MSESQPTIYIVTEAILEIEQGVDPGGLHYGRIL
jgi:hypothetical protein